MLFQFFTNRTWVFCSCADGKSGFIRQMASFICGRIFTLGIEEAVLDIFITWMGLNATIVKITAQVIVIALNYVISKLIVFRMEKE